MLFFGSFVEQCGQRPLALDQRRGCQVLAVEMQQIEHVVDHPVVAAVLQVVLQRGEIGHAVFIDRGDLAVEDGVVVGKRRAGGFHLREFTGPVETGAGLQA